ncbi:MAG: NupC/NupG family nucleoside CNT transporter [Halobacteriovoraceae bacterium]|nr:NupC/NupG family nucleoside CNT transporter [Halobacteriovoraceae bacterium]MCB9093965.1 NupC/NupG family nucleoside CNT transporter [Halobacteriovoraceae bacterium]
MDRLISFIGLLFFVGVAYLLSTDRKKVVWRTVISGVILQFVFAILILKTSFGLAAFDKAKDFFNAILGFTDQGSKFLFGSLHSMENFGMIFAIMVLPTIIFMSSLMSILYHMGIMQKIVEWMALLMMKVMGTSGAESLSAAANIFVGQTEAPLVVRPYVDDMTNSELMALMTGGMATVAGGVLAAYVGFGIDAGHLLSASVMSAPAALVCAKLLVPETQVSNTAGEVKIQFEKNSVNLIDAAANGAGEGLKLALNVGAMLLAFIALIAMINGILSWFGGLFGFSELSFELIMGYVFAPVSFMMGVPWDDCFNVGVLLAKKLVVNEFVAYLDLKDMRGILSDRAVVISTYALCGFANFSSIAIQIGGIGTLAPKRRQDLSRLGIRSLIGGTLACLMTACIAGILV